MTWHKSPVPYVTFWALMMTALWFFERQNKAPLILAPTSSVSHENRQYEQLEFIRFFTTQWLDYNHESYWKQQASLTALMEKDLQKKTQNELKERYRRRNEDRFEQRISLESITTFASSYISKGKIRGFHKAKPESTDDKNTDFILHFTLRLEIKAHDRRFDNPWGFSVSALELETEPLKESEPFKQVIATKNKNPLILNFPCKIQNILYDQKLPLTSKITVQESSEVQLLFMDQLEKKPQLTFQCPERDFVLEFMQAELEPRDMYISVPLEAGRTKNKNSLTKTREQIILEKELGFKTDEAGK